MKKCLLIDGNAMLFRAYYATVYTNMLKTSNGIPTNAVFGFINMYHKAIDLVKPDWVMVAFDSGKPTFRHETYTEYKGTRKSLDAELIAQFPIIREFLEAAGIPWYECDGIEADDIIGSCAKQHPQVETIILSSDRDLLQLIDDTTQVLLMKKGISEMVLMDEKNLMETMQVTPPQIIELKSLMGDTADNIPGIKGIGEKTAIKLLHQYHDLENIYAHIDEQKGKLKEKLIDGKASAELSKYLATIVIDAQLPFTLEECVVNTQAERLNQFFRKYEMQKFMLKEEAEAEKEIALNFDIVERVDEGMLSKPCFFFIDSDFEDVKIAAFYGLSIANQEEIQYIRLEDLKQDVALLDYLKSDMAKATYDCKHMYHLFDREGIEINHCDFDLMIASFLNDGCNSYDSFVEKYHLKLANPLEIYGKKGKPKPADENEHISYCTQMAHEGLRLQDSLSQALKEKEQWTLFEEIEMPLTKVLFEMEKAGICTDLAVLNEIAKETNDKINELSSQIYEQAGHEFNINSPKQLASVLFDELGLKSGKKRSTAVDVLEKLMDKHPIIPLLMEQRKYQKIYSTYAVGLAKHVQADGKIHTIFNQCLTTTGRLSSSEPNLQNISVRDEEAKIIRKAFVPSEGNVLLSADYSQIELRMLAHMADVVGMIEAFNSGEDIHTDTAMSVFEVAKDQVTPLMRRQAKAVNFGIVYGISDFGLSEQLGISRKEAHEFIERYFNSYPQIRSYMDRLIAFCEEQGYVETLFHRRREIPEIHDKNYMTREFGKRAAMNAPIQGSSADLIKVAMNNVSAAMKEKGCRSKLILQIHDELIFDVPLDEIEMMKELVETVMEHAMELKVPLVAEASIGKNWYEAK